MRTLLSLLLTLTVAVLVAAAQGSRISPGSRPIDQAERRLDMDNRMPAPPPPVIRPRLDPAKVRSEADEIARLAQSLPVQVNQTEHGVLPKDLGHNLKRIEKLTKQLRRELNL
jgi:hypothetical protein